MIIIVNITIIIRYVDRFYIILNERLDWIQMESDPISNVA